MEEKMAEEKKIKVRNFHQAKWDEPVIFELSVEGERGIRVPEVEKDIEELVGDGISVLPESIRRDKSPEALSQAFPALFGR
jgi:glycine dehydrogenase subunit 2